VTAAHEQHETLHQDVLYPEHVQRTESEEFRRNKHHLVHELQLGCWICAGRTQLEVHHFACEWALWEDADPAKVLKTTRLIDPYGFTALNPNAPIASPDDARNLMVLCEKHHRAPYFGVHTITMPIWIAQKVAKDGVEIIRAPVKEPEHAV
jgi:hypothetical protein